jgi:hypothetical protein
MITGIFIGVGISILLGAGVFLFIFFEEFAKVTGAKALKKED